MKTILLFIAILFSLCGNAQDGFVMEKGKRKVVIPFQLRSNLIFIDVLVNDVALTFLLDTGVAETVLFSLDENQSIKFNDTEKIQLQGMGNQAPINALKAKNISMRMPHFFDENHNLLIVLNQDVNFSPNVGIPVNGILGYDFFKNHPVQIDYSRKRIVILAPAKLSKRKLKRYQSIPIDIIKEKPYLDVLVKSGSKTISAKVLVDNGNSDGLWLFSDRNNSINIPEVKIADFLGRGFSGDIYGFKARIESMTIGDFEFKNIITSFPNAISTRNISSNTERLGSVGAEVLRRFDQIYDYRNNMLYLKPNKDFQQDFVYDKSGLQLQHDGLEWVKERIELNTKYVGEVFDGSGEKINNSFAYKFALKPIYKIFSVRSLSAAAEAGFQENDQVLSINGKVAYKLTLDQINKLLRGEENKLIRVEIKRGSQILQLSFLLKTVL